MQVTYDEAQAMTPVLPGVNLHVTGPDPTSVGKGTLTPPLQVRGTSSANSKSPVSPGAGGPGVSIDSVEKGVFHEKALFAIEDTVPDISHWLAKMDLHL
jgi:hypothetical protein